MSYEVSTIDQTMTFMVALKATHYTLPSGSKHVNRGCDWALADIFSFPSTILSPLLKNQEGQPKLYVVLILFFLFFKLIYFYFCS